MDKEGEGTSNSAASARKKRKLIIQTKEISRVSQIRTEKAISNPLPITPLSNVTNQFIHKPNTQPQSTTFAYNFVTPHKDGEGTINYAAASREKRKLIIATKENTRVSKIRTQKPVSNFLPVTPLSDVTNKFIHKANIKPQSKTDAYNLVTPDRYTPQPTSQQQQCRNKQATSIQSLGVNLFNQFSNARCNSSSSSSYLPYQEPTQGSCSKRKSPCTNPSFNHVDNIANYSLSDEDGESSSSESSEGDDEDSDIETGSDDLQSNPSYRPKPLPNTGYFNIGLPIHQCVDCGAKMWYQERSAKGRDSLHPKFQICCGQGKVQIPLLKHPPELLEHLLFNGKSAHSKNYRQNTRMYNAMFAFTSPGFKIDNNFGGGRGPPTIRIQGQPCHRIGSLLPKEGEQPKYIRS